MPDSYTVLSVKKSWFLDWAEDKICGFGQNAAEFIGMCVFDLFTFTSKRLADIKEPITSNRFIPVET